MGYATYDLLSPMQVKFVKKSIVTPPHFQNYVVVRITISFMVSHTWCLIIQLGPTGYRCDSLGLQIRCISLIPFLTEHDRFMISIGHGNVFRVTGLLRAPVDSSHKGPVMQIFDVSFVVSLKKVLNCQVTGDLRRGGVMWLS